MRSGTELSQFLSISNLLFYAEGSSNLGYIKMWPTNTTSGFAALQLAGYFNFFFFFFLRGGGGGGGGGGEGKWCSGSGP